MSENFSCWRCGEPLLDLILPLSRREECRHCNTDQHVCKMCRHFAADTSTQCEEERAEPPNDKEVANFCDYFSIDPNAGTDIGTASTVDDAKAQLDALFGDAEAMPEKSLDAGKSRAAEEELRRLFGDD